MTDPIEDLLAFLYATGKSSGATRSPDDADADDDICPNCGADLEYDDHGGCKRCPECSDP